MATYKSLVSLSLSWSTSRGRDTYGYNICRLDDNVTGKRYKCMGGGYDMTGTVFGAWLEDTQQDKLQQLVTKRAAELSDCGYAVEGYKKIEGLYGLTVNPKGHVSLDGATGISSMERIAEALGLEVQGTFNKKGHRIGFIVGELSAD